MKSILSKKSVKQTWLSYVIGGSFLTAVGLFIGLITRLRQGSIQSYTIGLVLMLLGFASINQATLVRGQREIKKSINDLKEKIDELKEKK